MTRALLLAWFMFGPAGETAAAQAVETTLAEARSSIDQGRPRDAIQALATLEPTPAVVLLRGVAHYHADEHVQAIELLRGVVEVLPQGSSERREAVQVLGLSLYETGRFQEALPLLEEARTWAGDAPELLHVLGRAYIQTRRADAAREAWARTFGVPPDSAAAHLLTGQMMVRLNFEDLAEAELRRAIEKDAKIPQAHYLLGQIAIFRARFEEGEALTRRELEVNPGNAMALHQLGDAFVRQGRWREAIDVLQKSVWINPYYSAPYILLGKAYGELDRPATAEGMLRRAVEYDPTNVQAHYLLGQLLRRNGRADEAARELGLAEQLRDRR